MSVCTGAPDCPAGEHIHGCYRDDRYRVSVDSTPQDPTRVVVGLLKEMYPSNPDVVLGREARLICEALNDADLLLTPELVELITIGRAVEREMPTLYKALYARKLGGATNAAEALLAVAGGTWRGSVLSVAPEATGLTVESSGLDQAGPGGAVEVERRQDQPEPCNTAAPTSSAECVCGEPATTKVEVAWADGKRVYRYCADCAADITETIEGTEVLP